MINTDKADEREVLTDKAFVNVPVAFLQIVIQNNIIHETRTYLFLKLKSVGGTLKISPADRKMLSNCLGYKSDKTLQKHLVKLQELKWLNYDSKSQLLFVKGFEALRLKFKLNGRRAVYLNSKDLITLKQFRGFAAGAIINNLVNSQKVRLKLVGQLTGCSIEDKIRRKSGYFQVANNALKKILCCSIGQAYNLKKLANSLGYIRVKKNYIKACHASDVHAFIQGYPEVAPMLIRKKDKYFVRDTDTVQGKMSFSRRVKI